MNRQITGTVMLCSLFLLLSMTAAHAAVPVPSEVPDDIVEPQRTELSARREELITRRDSIKLSVAIHNVKCGKVKPGSDTADECRENQAKLRSGISRYAEDVTAFNTLVIEAPRVLYEPGSGGMLSDNMITYFLLHRDKTYSIHNAIMRDMIADAAAPWKWPGRQKRHGRLSNPLDESQKIRDREILGPLDPEKLKDLTLDQAVRLVNERQDAREREATRKASERMHAEMEQLEEEGILKAGENVTLKKKNDPEFRRRLNSILSGITKQEIADVREARGLALQEMESIIEARAMDPAEKNRFDRKKEAVYNRRDAALKRINSMSLRHMSEEMERLKHEGYYSEGDDLAEKDRNDPAFRKAVDEAVRNVLIRQYEAKYRVHRKALNDIRSAAKELLHEQRQ